MEESTAGFLQIKFTSQLELPIVERYSIFVIPFKLSHATRYQFKNMAS